MESEPVASKRVWLVEVPAQGYRWFCEDYSRVLFWEHRGDAIVTPYEEKLNVDPERQVSSI